MMDGGVLCVSLEGCVIVRVCKCSLACCDYSHWQQIDKSQHKFLEVCPCEPTMGVIRTRVEGSLRFGKLEVGGDRKEDEEEEGQRQRAGSY